MRKRARQRAQRGHSGKMRQLLALQLRVRGHLLLARDVDCDAEYSRRFIVAADGWTAAACGDPPHRTITEDHSKLGLIMAAVRQCALDRGVAYGEVVLVDA